MKLLTFQTGEGLKLGIKTDMGVLDVLRASEVMNTEVPQSLDQVLKEGETAVKNLSQLIEQAESNSDKSLYFHEEELHFGPAVPNPEKIICVGLNYRKHAEESGMPIPEAPILFNKFNNAIAAHQAVIALPFNSEQIDYEAELAIVIGKTAKRVTKEEALDFVFGYTMANDLSARDLQFRTHQWLLGKSLDGFNPVGPYLVTADEVKNPDNLGIRSIVNGEIRQDSNTSDMIFDCAEIVSYISQHMTLVPGDIILTGTPEGVILGYPEDKRVWLKDGDEVTIEIEKLGRLTNTMKKEN